MNHEQLIEWNRERGRLKRDWENLKAKRNEKESDNDRQVERQRETVQRKKKRKK